MPAKAPRGFQPVPPQTKVVVTQKRINDSIASASAHCAIATSIADSIPGSSHISVDVATIRFTQGEKRYTYFTPAKAQVFILTFDAGDPVEPISFVLRKGTVGDVARRPGIGGRPKGKRPASAPPAIKSHPGRRTFGARSMTAAKIAAAKTKAVVTAPSI